MYNIMKGDLQKRRRTAFDLIFLFRWYVGKEEEANWAKINQHEFAFKERLLNLKHAPKSKKAQSEGENPIQKIKIVYKEYIEPFFYYWICIDPSFSPKYVFDDFSKGCEIGNWDFLNPFTYEPTDKLCYYVRFDTKYKDEILLPKYHTRIQKRIIEICKNYNNEYVDSTILANNVSFYAYAPISESAFNVAKRMKAKLTNLFNTEIPEIKQEFLKRGRNPEKFPWSDGTFFALSLKKPPTKISIQYTLDAILDSIQIPDQLENLENLVTHLKKELKEQHQFDPHELTTNMILMYKIQMMREKLNEKSLFDKEQHIFEVTYRTETTPIQWGLIKCQQESTFYDFVRDLHQYLIEAGGSSGIFKHKKIKEIDLLNTLRIAGSHDIGMNYDGRNENVRQNVGKYYNELIGKTIPTNNTDFLNLQTKILHLVFKVMDRIYKEQMD